MIRSHPSLFDVTLLGVLALFGSQRTFAQCAPEEASKLLASDGKAGDRFGRSVSIAGDVALVGAHWNDDAGMDSGSAYVFRFNPLLGGSWTQEALLVPEDADEDDFFGVSVDTDGERLVIGSRNDGSGVEDSGSVYVFRNDGGAWVEEEKLTAFTTSAFDYFGEALAVSGDVIVVGAWGENASAGAAYVFRRVGSTWTQEARLEASDSESDDRFGETLDVSGDAIVVGAWGDDDAGSASGAAYVFRFDGTTWNEAAKLTASDAEPLDLFGQSVEISNGVVVVGALHDDDAGISSGSAYVFGSAEEGGGSWDQEAKLVASDADQADFFGHTVSIGNDRIVIGAYADDDEGSSSGSAYLFGLVDGEWTEQSKVTASDGEAADEFGYDVATDGIRALVGAHMESENGVFAGAAYVFNLNCLTGVPAELTNFNVAFGEHISGGIGKLTESDDKYMIIRSEFGLSAFEPNVMELQVSAKTGVTSPSTLNVTVEARLDNPGGVSRLRMLNWDTNLYELVDLFGLTTTDQAHTTFGIDAENYVRSDNGKMKVSIRHAVIATFSLAGFRSFIDLVEVRVD